MRIGVISDTHIPRRARELPLWLLESLDGVDMIIHAGDIVDLRVLDQLEQLAPVSAVAGNVDPMDVRDRLPRKILVPAGGINIGVIHGDGTSSTTMNRSKKAFSEEKPECIVFGHSHTPAKEWVDGTLMFNPGSPTDRRKQPYPSFGLITVDGILKAEIFYFDGERLI